jgi:hypothetical protein
MSHLVEKRLELSQHIRRGAQQDVPHCSNSRKCCCLFVDQHPQVGSKLGFAQANSLQACRTRRKGWQYGPAESLACSRQRGAEG